MERRLKERLTGAVVLIVLAVIFIPMLLDNSAPDNIGITGTNIPPAPDIEFRSTVAPVEDLAPPEPPQLPVEPLPVAGPLSGDADATDIPETAATETITPVTGAASPEVTAPASSQQQTGPAKPVPEQKNIADSVEDASRNLSAWVVQLGSFSSQQNAEGLVRRLQTNGFPGYIEPVKSGAETVYKVRVGPELSRTEAEAIQKNLKSRLNLDAIILRFP